MTTPTTSVLTAQDLIIDVPGRPGGRALNLAVQPGQVWGVLGPNGAGKTTLLHTLAGLIAPRAGQVMLDDTALSRMRRRGVAQKLGILFQERGDGFPATVEETAMLGRHPYLSYWQRESAEDARRVQAALERLDVAHLCHRQVGTLSGGERQRVAVATLLTQDPGVWLVDEPTNHLDLHHQSAVMALMAEQAAAGRALVLCLHDLNLAARWCSHVLLLYPDGEACWGEAQTMLEPCALEQLYRQRLRVVDVDGAPVFVPVNG
ncbi:MAG: ABC transporter ATP-binding protein [Halomonas sp.]|nr:ABC transporter ATP-binding protein [Halomonas sp.]MDN6296480.1 ABC transporter ATP-binding protein [Halomonas sp.]MDN6313833.1 ABC transporter ATP-binding protein [Halomonas sp.]MDN6335287.1 ABC transporter ATP-binding protein [Halomonas sp.]